MQKIKNWFGLEIISENEVRELQSQSRILSIWQKKYKASEKGKYTSEKILYWNTNLECP